MKYLIAAVAAALFAASAGAQSPDKAKPAAAPALSEHVKKDISRHRAMSKAHDEAARCLEAGTGEDECQKRLLAACRGLAIGKYCGLKHVH